MAFVDFQIHNQPYRKVSKTMTSIPNLSFNQKNFYGNLEFNSGLLQKVPACLYNINV